MSKPPQLSPDYLGEGIELHAEASAKFAANRWWSQKFWLDVLGDVFADCRAAFGKFRAAAHRAETLDREALAKLDRLKAGLADGTIDREDLALLAKIRRDVMQSAELDHEMSEAKP